MYVSTFMKSSSKVIICQRLGFLWKPNNTGKDIWPWPRIANQNLKQNALTQNADGLQAMSVLYMILIEAVIQQ